MLRTALAGVAVAAFAFVPKACVKQKPAEPDLPSPVPVTVPVTSATTPPIWSPPDTGGGPATTSVATGATAAPPPPSPELIKARAAADAKEFKKVRTLLEKKVRGGRCAPEESQLVYRACVQLKDKACADAVKAKHGDDLND